MCNLGYFSNFQYAISLTVQQQKGFLKITAYFWYTLKVFENSSIRFEYIDMPIFLAVQYLENTETAKKGVQILNVIEMVMNVIAGDFFSKIYIFLTFEAYIFLHTHNLNDI